MNAHHTRTPAGAHTQSPRFRWQRTVHGEAYHRAYHPVDTNTCSQAQQAWVWATHTLPGSRTSFASQLASLRGSLEKGREGDRQQRWRGCQIGVGAYPGDLTAEEGKHRVGLTDARHFITDEPEEPQPCGPCLLLSTCSLLEAGSQRTHTELAVPEQMSA